MTGPTIANAFLAGVQPASTARLAASHSVARAVAAVAALHPSARERKKEGAPRRLESVTEGAKAWGRGTQAGNPRGRQAFEAELSARVDPVLRRGAQRRRGRRVWRASAASVPAPDPRTQ